MFRWLFGGIDERQHMDLVFEYMQRARAAEARAETLRRGYTDLRRAIASRCCANGRDNPTQEPLASILREHDDSMNACGYSLPR